MSERKFDIIVVGSGFAGSLMAMIARRLGFSVGLLERGRHPRFAIGESSTPLANLLLEELAETYGLFAVRPLCKWGTWQSEMPQIACGLKRGFTFYHHQLGEPFAPDPDRQRQLMVGASPNEQIADTHWYRPDFDHYLVNQARELGIEYLDEVELAGAVKEPTGLRLAGHRHGENVNFHGGFVIDATGPRGFLHRALHLPEKFFPKLPSTQSLFAHFADVSELPDCFSPAGSHPPYPPEQAAVHHVFRGGWIWVLKFNTGITSAGVAATDALADELKLSDGEPAWRRLLAQLPSLAATFCSSRIVTPFVYQPRLAFRSGLAVGQRWAMLPSAMGVVDPLLSTGFPLTLLGITRLAKLLPDLVESSGKSEAAAEYAALSDLELETTSILVGALYETMDRFDLFAGLSLLYFAAASYSETARRLNKPGLANEFLLCRNPEFSANVHRLCRLAIEARELKEIAEVQQQIRAAIEPFDVAGLTDTSRHPWYPALVEDVMHNRHKVGATEQEITAMLSRVGLQFN